MAGDVGVVPRNMGHFIENLSDDEPLEVLEIFRAGMSSASFQVTCCCWACNAYSTNILSR